MASVTALRPTARWYRLAAWLPLLILPAAVAWITWDWPAWVSMWTLAISVYAGCKCLSFVDSIDTLKPTAGRSLGYLFLWPGMDAKSFFAPAPHVDRLGVRECIAAIGKTLLGGILIGAATLLVDRHPLVARGSAWWASSLLCTLACSTFFRSHGGGEASTPYLS